MYRALIVRKADSHRIFAEHGRDSDKRSMAEMQRSDNVNVFNVSKIDMKEAKGKC